MQEVYSSQQLNKSDPKKIVKTPLKQKELKTQQASALIDEVWHEFKNSVYEKVAVLAQVKKQVLNRNFNEDLQQKARQTAHTLVGSLGTFGLQKGSAIARELEQALLPNQILTFEQVQQFESLVQTLRAEIENSPPKFGEHSVADPTDNLPLHIERTVTRQIQQQSTIAQLGLAALRGTNIETLMPSIMLSVMQSLDIEFCCLLKQLKSKQAFLVKYGMGWPEGIIGTALLPAQNSQALYTLKTKQAITTDNLATETRFSLPKCLQNIGVTSSLCVLVEVETKPYGVLSVYTHHQHIFRQDEIDFLEAISQIIGGAFHQKQMRLSLQKLHQELD